VAVIPRELDIARFSTDELSAVFERGPVVVLVPVGAVEPHGPHLPLITDITISQAASVRATGLLADAGITALIGPAVPYGVTNCAAAFRGAISVEADVLTSFLTSVVKGYLADGAAHVCLVNNHLEPAHVRATSAVVQHIASSQVSVACPVSKRWARTLSDEFKSGACHAGEYETSIMMTTTPDLVREDKRSGLPELDISLSDALSSGVEDFKEMGLDRAYTGAPARATAAHGSEQLDRLAEMIATEVREAIQPPKA
jgi:creatinine amidohydrolase